MTEWAHVYHIYYRVLIWHAVSLHILAAAAFGGWNWGAISTACVTHSLLKLLRVIVDARIGHPPRSSSSSTPLAPEPGRAGAPEPGRDRLAPAPRCTTSPSSALPYVAVVHSSHALR